MKTILKITWLFWELSKIREKKNTKEGNTPKYLQWFSVKVLCVILFLFLYFHIKFAPKYFRNASGQENICPRLRNIGNCIIWHAMHHLLTLSVYDPCKSQCIFWFQADILKIWIFKISHLETYLSEGVFHQFVSKKEFLNSFDLCHKIGSS